MHSLQATSARLDTTLAQLDAKALQARLDSTMRSTGQLADQLTATSARMDSLLARIQRGEGTLGKLSADSGLYVDLRKTIQSTNNLIDELTKNPGKIGIGVLLVAPDGRREEKSFLLNCTGCNNEAELHALGAVAQDGAQLLLVGAAQPQDRRAEEQGPVRGEWLAAQRRPASLLGRPGEREVQHEPDRDDQEEPKGMHVRRFVGGTGGLGAGVLHRSLPA